MLEALEVVDSDPRTVAGGCGCFSPPVTGRWGELSGLGRHGHSARGSQHMKRLADADNHDGGGGEGGRVMRWLTLGSCTACSRMCSSSSARNASSQFNVSRSLSSIVRCISLRWESNCWIVPRSSESERRGRFECGPCN